MSKNLARHSMRWTFIIIFISLVFVAFFTGFARVSLPFVGAYRAEIQSYVSNFLGKTVEIGALDMSWQKFGPRLVLHDVDLDSGSDSSQNVTLKKIYFDLDLLRSWMNGAWQINEVTIVGAKLSFDYYGKQKIRVYGENIDGETRDLGASNELDVLSWLMQADRVGLLDSSVTLRHIKRGFSVEVRDLNVRVNNQDGLHQIRVDLQVPSLSKSAVALNLNFTGDRNDLINSAGVFNFSMNDLDLEKVGELFEELLPLSVKGQSNLALWGRWSNGEVNSLRMQSAIAQSEWLNRKSLTTLSVPSSWSDWVVVKNDDEYRLALNSLQINNVEKDLDLLLKVRPQEQKSWWLNAKSNSLDLSSTTPMVKFLAGFMKDEPFINHSQIESLSGDLKDWHIQVNGRQGQFPKISADTKLTNLSVGNSKELAGFIGMDAQLTMRDNSGYLDILDDSLVVNLPKWFNTPHKLSKLKTRLGFRVDRGRIALESDKVFIRSGELAAIARVKLQKNAGFDTYLEVEGEASDMSIATAREHLPEKIMTPKLLKWFDSTFSTGRIVNAHMEVKGPSRGFPYANGKGVFNADFDFENGVVKPIKNWPAVNIFTASAKFRQNGMTADVSRANTQGNSLSKVNLSITDLKRPILKLQGRASSEMNTALSYISETPLKDSLEVLLKSASGTGNLALDLSVTAPVYDNPPPLEFAGNVVLKENSWQSEDLGLNIQNINGSLQFSEKSLVTSGLTAEAFNSPVILKANIDKNQPNLFSRISVDGNIRASTVLENYNLPISHWFDGQSEWSLQLELKRDENLKNPMRVSLSAQSELVGTSVSLPKPYRKEKNAKGQLSANITLGEKSSGQRWNLSYAGHLHARVETTPAGDGLEALTVRFNEPLPAIAHSFDGVSLEGRAPELAFDGWVATLSDVIGRIDGVEGERRSIMPVRGELHTDNLVVGQVSSGPAKLSFATDDENISTAIESTWLAGDLHYPRQYWLKERYLKSRLSLLDKRFLDSLATAEGDDQSRIDPRDFPPMTLAVDKFVWDEYHVADLNMRTVPVADGMKTTALGFVHSDLQMVGNANWRLLDPQGIAPSALSKHRTDVRFSLKSDDVGAGLEGIGILGAFSGGQGQVDVNLAWEDAAYAPDLRLITGSVKPQLSSGRILAVEPGAAKILGLFALQAVPRRLLLDFNDVTKEGLLYDEISGDINIADGVATTNYMQLNGPIGVVSSSGTTDFVHSNYDQQIVVLPRLTSALPIIGLLSAGATAGVGVLVADQILKGVGVNFDEVGKREYRLTGSWDDPKIRRVHVPIKHLPEPENR